MIPGMNSGDTAFKRYQEQVHQQIEEPLRWKIDRFMNFCCMESEGISNWDIEFLYEMAGIMDPDGNIGLIDMLNEKNIGPVGLRDRETALSMKGIIEGYIRATWYEENKPRSQVADTIDQRLEETIKTSYEDYAKEHPEIAQKASLETENVAKQIKDLQDALTDLEEKYRKAIEEISDMRTSNIRRNEPKEEKRTEVITDTKTEKGILAMEIPRSWKVAVKDNDEIDLETGTSYPDNFEGFIPFKFFIDNDSGRHIAMMQYEIHVKGKEEYDNLWNRLKNLIIQFLLNGKIETNIPLNTSFNERMDYYPRLENGEIRRILVGKIDTRHFKGEGTLIIKLGSSFISVAIKMERNDIPAFVDNFADLLEMIISSSEERKEMMK